MIFHQSNNISIKTPNVQDINDANMGKGILKNYVDI